MMRSFKKKSILWLLVVLSLLLVPGPYQVAGEQIWYKDRVAVLAYHHLDNRQTGNVTITPERFRSQLADLLQRGYHFISLQQFRSFMNGGEVPVNAVLVTFDDGYRSFYTEAFPILQEFDIPAVNFVITQDLDAATPPLIPTLTRDEIREMTTRSDSIDVQCHSDSLHARTAEGFALLTTRLSKNGVTEDEARYDRRIKEDTGRCINKLKQLYKSPVNVYAYPFGEYDNVAVELLKQSGVSYAFTTESGVAARSDDWMRIPRINGGSPFVRANSLNNLILRSIRHPERQKKHPVSVWEGTNAPG